MRQVSLKFMHAHSGCMQTLLGLGVDLFTDVLMAVLATSCLKVSESAAVTETMITRYRTLFLWRRWIGTFLP